MLISALVGLLGGATSILAAALGPASGYNSVDICSLQDTITTIQTVTASPDVIVISIINPDAEISSLVSAITVSSATTAIPETTGDATTLHTSFGTVTRTLTLDSVSSNVATASAYGGGFYSIGSSSSALPYDVSSLESSSPSAPSSSVNAVSGVSTTISTTESTDVIHYTTLHTTVIVTQSVHVNSSLTTFPHSNCSPCRSIATSLITSTVNESCSTTSTDDVTTVTVTEASTTTTVIKPSNTSTVNPANLTASSTSSTLSSTLSVQTVTSVYGTVAATYASSLSAYGNHHKRSVCQLVTATMSNGDVIVFPNAWDGYSYVPTCTMSSSAVAPVFEPPPTPYSTLESSATTTAVVPTLSTSQISPISTGPTSTSSAPSSSSMISPETTGPYGSYPYGGPSSSSSTSVESSDTSSSLSTIGPVTGTSSLMTSTVTVLTTSSTTSLVSIPTFPSSNVIRSSSATYATWNATLTSTASASSATSIRPTYSSTSSAAASPSACGEIGVFQITFDDLPVNSASDNDTAPFPPIFQPYHHFQWSFGWSYVPPPTDPYAPQGGERLGMYMNETANDTFAISPYTSIEGGWFGGGSVAPLSSTAYWFDANDAYVGCDNGPWNNATKDCVVTARGYHYNTVETVEEVASFTWSIPPCKVSKNCQLLPIVFDDQFVSLAILSFEAKVGDKEVFLFIDSIVGTWTNNSCAAGLQRSSTR